MKIKIVSCNNPAYWYSNKIGLEFEVRDCGAGDYLLDYKGDFCFILKIDCIVLNNKLEKESKMDAKLIEQLPTPPPEKLVQITMTINEANNLRDLFGGMENYLDNISNICQYKIDKSVLDNFFNKLDKIVPGNRILK